MNLMPVTQHELTHIQLASISTNGLSGTTNSTNTSLHSVASALPKKPTEARGLVTADHVLVRLRISLLIPAAVWKRYITCCCSPNSRNTPLVSIDNLIFGLN